MTSLSKLDALDIAATVGRALGAIRDDERATVEDVLHAVADALYDVDTLLEKAFWDAVEEEEEEEEDE